MVAAHGRYWIAPDGEDEPTIWHDAGNPFGPDPVARRCELRPAAWALLCRAIGEEQ